MLNSGEVVDTCLLKGLYTFLGLNRTLQLVQGLVLNHFVFHTGILSFWYLITGKLQKE